MGHNVLADLLAAGWPIIRQGLAFLVGLTIVVFVHELGHFLVARWCGIRVLVFSLGFGPEVVGFDDRHGTRWKISAVPLGGYVKFFGDDNAASAPDRQAAAEMTDAEKQVSFPFQPVPSRAAVVAAGPFANFLLAIVIFAGLLMVYGKPSTKAYVDSVTPGSAAAAAGFQPGDLVLAIDGQPIEDFADMQRIVSTSPGQTLQIEIERGGAHRTLRAVPELKEIKDALGTHRIGQLGISRGDVRTQPVPPLKAVALAVDQTVFIAEQSFRYLGRLLVGRDSPDQLGGPVRIAQAFGEAATLGLSTFLNLTGLISVSVGLLNLFPIPLLDGGHLLFYAVEAIRGRPLSERAQDIGFRIGLAIVVMLMIFVTFNDIFRLATS